jgi:hypothetical protein
MKAEINKDGNYNGCIFDLKQKKWAEIISTSQEVKDDFVLPEKWCINTTLQIVEKYLINK